MNKYSRMSSVAVLIGACRVKCTMEIELDGLIFYLLITLLDRVVLLFYLVEYCCDIIFFAYKYNCIMVY